MRVMRGLSGMAGLFLLEKTVEYDKLKIVQIR